jgi:hypothetical protein
MDEYIPEARAQISAPSPSRDVSLTESHSVEEADQRHRAKARLAKPATGHTRADGGTSTPGG